MYHSLSIRAGSSSSSALENVMYCFLSVGREPGRLASSILSWWSSSSVSEGTVEDGSEGSRAVEIEGWEIEFWPVMIVPSVRLTEM